MDEHFSERTPITSALKISRRFSIFVLCICLGLVLSVITYKGPFYFWQYQLSDLGEPLTENGIPNVLARIIFDTTMLTSGILMVTIFSLFSFDKSSSHKTAKRVISLTSAAGFFLLILPYNFYEWWHITGGVFAFGMLWVFVVLRSIELNRSHHRLKAIISQAILQPTVVPYAVLFVLQQPAEIVAQKFAVLGLVVAVWLTTRASDSRPSTEPAGDCWNGCRASTTH